MKELIKHLGVIVILAGVLALAIPSFQATQTNTTLSIGLVLVLVGLFAHIIINRVMTDK